MRRRARTDANHAEVRDGLRGIPGCVVHDLSDVGRGVADLLVSYRGRLLLMEVKDGRRPPSERRLTAAEEKFRGDFRRHYVVVLSLDDALAAIGIGRAAA